MLNIQKIKWAMLLMCLLVVTGMAKQITPQSQTNTQTESKSFVYQNIRITVTKRGIVAGDLRTGKVVWRDGFWQNPTTFVVMERFFFFGEYFFYQFYSEMGGVGGGLAYTLSGKAAASGVDFYLKEGSYYYLNDATIAYIRERYFAAIAIKEFNSATKKERYVVIEPDRYVNEACRTDSVGGGYSADFFKFVSKRGNIWTFGLINKKCDITLTFNDLDVTKFSITEKRINK